MAILDLHLPDLDGVALAAAIRDASAGAAAPIVILSSLGMRERQTEDIAAFLVKPVKPSALHDTLMTVAGRASRTRPGAHPAGRTSTTTWPRRHPLRILLTEDNPVNQKLALRLLERMGYRADLAANGLEAIDAVERGALRRRPHGRPDARARRPRGDAPDPRALAGTTARTSWR